MPKKKITIIISSLEKIGGAENVANYQSLLSQKYDITYITFYNGKPSYNPKCKIFCANELKSTNLIHSFIKIFTRTLFIKKIASNIDSDILLAHMQQSAIPTIIAKIFFLTDTKTIVCNHSPLKAFHGRIHCFFLSLLYLKTDVLVTVSQNSFNDFLFKKFLKKKHVTIYNAINIDEIARKKIYP
jgi:hypothetical protein